MKQVKTLSKLLMLAAGALLSAGCSVIDDNLDACPQPDNGYRLDYELRLVTNMSTELDTQLDTQTDISVASALRSYLSTIFTDYAHDVDLSFYDTAGDSARLYHDQHEMNANQASYTLNLPMRRYQHLAAANVNAAPGISLRNGERCHRALLALDTAADGTAAPDTVGSHTAGLFTARLPMEVLQDVDQHFDVHLYIANCAASLVVDTIGSGIRDMKVFATGFATGYSLADSTFIFDRRSPVVRTVPIAVSEPGRQVFCSVSFPSPESDATRSIIETADPFVSTEAGNALWELHVYATTAQGSVTANVLRVTEPLRAGQLKVIKAQVFPNGSLFSDEQTVAVSVTLDWNSGGNHDIPL